MHRSGFLLLNESEYFLCYLGQPRICVIAKEEEKCPDSLLTDSLQEHVVSEAIVTTYPFPRSCQRGRPITQKSYEQRKLTYFFELIERLGSQQQTISLEMPASFQPIQLSGNS
jgi:hypothetical protein